MNRSLSAAVGAFIIAGILLFGVGLFLIGDRRMLFSDTFEVHAEFANIGGLQNGAKCFRRGAAHVGHSAGMARRSGRRQSCRPCGNATRLFHAHRAA